MDNVKKYLKTVFGNTITFIEEAQLVKKLTGENIDCELLTFKLRDGLNQYVLVRFEKKFDIRTKTIQKLISDIRKEVDAIPVLIFNELRINQRNVLVESGIAFVVPQYQIYIPNTIISLIEKDITKKTYSEYFSVSAQIVYIFILLNNIRETNARQLDKRLLLSVATINRALKELVDRGLLETVGNNTRKLYKMNSRIEFWKKGKVFLFNPVSKVLYSEQISYRELYSNKYALYKIVNPDSRINNTRYYGISAERLNRISESFLIDECDFDEKSKYAVVEVFKYNPAWLSKGKYIDPISLYAQLKDSKDEDTLIALKEMLEETVGL